MRSVTSLAAGAAIAGLILAPAPAQARARAVPAATMPGTGPEADYPVTVGDPYVIGGVTYTPADTLNYDAVGYAHAGTEGSGISGAHHALPLPCYVEVTALDTGHTVLVRLDRRGPMNGKQLLELSPAAWAQLGMPAGAGDVPVRVRRVNPPENERALLRSGSHAPDRMETPPGLLTALRRKLGIATPATPDEPPSTTLSGAPVPTDPRVRTARPAPATRPAPRLQPVAMPHNAATPAPPPQPVAPPPPPPMVPTEMAPPVPTTHHEPAPKPKPAEPVKPVPAHAAPAHTAPAHTALPEHHLIIQVAAFSSRERAEKAAAQVGGSVEAAGKLWRVRMTAGDEDEARTALAKAKKAGYAGAIILHHD